MPIEYVIREQGAIVRRNVREDVLNVPPDFLQRLNGDTNLIVRDIMTASGPQQFSELPVHGRIGTKYSYYTMRLPAIVFQCTFKTIAGDPLILFPDFTGGQELVMVWEAPHSMALAFVVSVNHDRHPTTPTQWLFAVDPQGVTWRLPIANLFEDCKLCLGDGWADPGSHSSCVSQALQQLIKSPWNKDLWGAAGNVRDHTAAMFRWSVDKEGKRSQLPVPENWQPLCTKVAVDAFKHVVL